MHGGRTGRGPPAAAFTSGPSRRDGPPDEVIARALATGKVVLQNKGLEDVPESVFTAGAAVDAWWTVEPLRLLDFTGNRIGKIPDLSQFHETLGTVRFGSNALTTVPATLASLGALKLLDLSKNHIIELPAALLSMPSIVELNLSRNRLASLGDLRNMVSLEILRVSENCLAALEGELPPRLLELDVSKNQLERVWSSLGVAARLTTLNASCNRLGELPSLAGCSALVVLDLRQNSLREAPFLPSGAALREVYLGVNAINALDPACLVRPSITTLDISANRLVALPRELRGLRSLHTLDVRDNEVSELPPWLGFIPSLVRLAISGNPMRSLKRSLLATAAGSEDGGAGATEALKAYLRSRADEADAVDEEESLASGGAGGLRRAGGAAGRAPDYASMGDGAASAAFEILTTTTVGHSAPRGRSPAACAAAVQAAWIAATREASSASGRLAAVPFFADGPAAGEDGRSGAAAGLGAGRMRGAAGGIGIGRAAAESAAARAGTDTVGQLVMLSISALDGGPLQLLRRLRVLDLTNQAIGPRGGLPAGLLTACPQLESIILKSNGLDAIPDALLEAAGPALARAPTGAGTSEGGLRELVLAGNPAMGAAMRGRPLDVALLPQSLQSLDLSGCSLRVLPAGLPRLPHLRTVLLSANEITFPAGSVAASAAAVAKGDYAGFADDDGALYLRSAVHVDLSTNQLTALPLSLAASRTLETLDVRHNELSLLPPRIAAIPSLSALCADGNPQRGVRPALLDRGPAAVVAFLRDRLRADTAAAASAADEVTSRRSGSAAAPADGGRGMAVSSRDAYAPADRFAEGTSGVRHQPSHASVPDAASHHHGGPPLLHAGSRRDGPPYGHHAAAASAFAGASGTHISDEQYSYRPSRDGAFDSASYAHAPHEPHGHVGHMPLPSSSMSSGRAGAPAGGFDGYAHHDAYSSRGHEYPGHAHARAHAHAPATDRAWGARPEAVGGPWDGPGGAGAGRGYDRPDARAASTAPAGGYGFDHGYAGTSSSRDDRRSGWPAGCAPSRELVLPTSYEHYHSDARPPPPSRPVADAAFGARPDSVGGPQRGTAGGSSAAGGGGVGSGSELAAVRSQIAALEAELLTAGTTGPLPGALRRKIQVLRVQESRLL